MNPELLPDPPEIVPVDILIVTEDPVIFADCVGRLPVALGGTVWPFGPPVEFDRGNGG